jgi:hypothetical protein
VDDFIQILLMIPIGETSTTYIVCDDTLGGLTAIDPRKFADEFLKRRRADEQGWTSVSAGSGGAAPSSAAVNNSFKGYESVNSFTVVGQKAGKKKNKK